MTIGCACGHRKGANSRRRKPQRTNGLESCIAINDFLPFSFFWFRWGIVSIQIERMLSRGKWKCLRVCISKVMSFVPGRSRVANDVWCHFHCVNRTLSLSSMSSNFYAHVAYSCERALCSTQHLNKILFETPKHCIVCYTYQNGKKRRKNREEEKRCCEQECYQRFSLIASNW